jgi:aryl sulfotransferase
MDFDEITCVIPWNINALDCGQRMTDEHVANPRCFKTHDTYDEVPKGCKYIVVVRDPRDVLVSFHAFLCDWGKTDARDFTVADFAEVLFCGKGSRSGDYWNHLASWLDHINDPNVLFLFFEDLKKYHPQCVQAVAKFMSITDAEALKIATQQSSFEFMRDHARQFDDHFLASNVARRNGYVVDLAVGKVREGGGQVGGHKNVLTPSLIAQLDRRWQQTIFPRFSFPSYDAFHRRHGLQI